MAVNPVIRNDKPDSRPRRRRQAVKTDNPAGMRLNTLLGERDFAWLSAQTGIPASTLSDYVQKGISRADNAVKIAKALGTTVEFLVEGGGEQRRSWPVSDASESDWIDVPTFDLRELQDDEKGKSVRQTPFRRDWLNNELGTDTRLWITSLLGDYPAASLAAGDLIIARDIEAGELIDRQLCLWREIESGLIFVARFAAFSSERTYVDPNGEQWIGRVAIAPRDNPPEVVPVGRIMGRPIAPVR